MKTLVIINLEETGYADIISDFTTRDDVILIKNPKNIDDLRRQLEKHRGEFDEVFINAHGSMGKIEPNLKIAYTSLTIPEIIDLVNHQNDDLVKDIHLASCHVGSHFESLENNYVSSKYYSDLSTSLQPGQTLFLHGDEHISTTKEGKSRLLAIADHESGPITHSILASSEELKVIHRNHKNLRGSPSFTIFEHTPYNEFISESTENPLEHLRAYLAGSLEKAKRFEIDNGIFHDPSYAKKLSQFTDEDLKKYLNEAFELELIKSPDPMQVMQDWGYLLKSGAVDVRHDKNDWTMLMYSAYHGHVDAVKALLADGEVGEKFAKKGEMALILATRNAQTAAVEALLDSDKLDLSHNSKSVKSALDISKEKGFTQISELIEDRILDWRIKENPQKFLFDIIDKGDEETLKKIIDGKKIDLDIRDENGESALIHAVKKQNSEIVKLLADSGADINLSDKNGNTALKEAVNVQDFNIIELLSKYDGITRGFGQEYSQQLLTLAVKTGNYKTVEALLMADKEFDINFLSRHRTIGDRVDVVYDEEITPLQISVVNDDVATTKLLLDDSRIKPEKAGGPLFIQNPALCMATIKGNIEIVKLFVTKANEDKVDINIFTGGRGMHVEETPLMIAARTDNAAIARELYKAKTLDSNFKIPDSSRNALVEAVKSGSVEIVKMLVDDPNTDLHVEEYGRPVLDIAQGDIYRGVSQKLRGSSAIASLIEESQKCRTVNKVSNPNLQNNKKVGEDVKKDTFDTALGDIGLHFPDTHTDPRLSLNSPQHQKQINDLDRLGFAQAALFLVAAGLLVKYFMGRWNPNKSPKTASAEQVDNSSRNKGEGDKSL